MTQTDKPAIAHEVLAGSQPEPDHEHEPRVLRRTDRSGLVTMMSEIHDAIFVAWDTCSTCSKPVKGTSNVCTCTNGPTEPSYITRWREKRFEDSVRRRVLPYAKRQVLGEDLGLTYEDLAVTALEHLSIEVDPDLVAALGEALGSTDVAAARTALRAQVPQPNIRAVRPEIQTPVDSGLDAALVAVQQAKED